MNWSPNMAKAILVREAYPLAPVPRASDRSRIVLDVTRPAAGTATLDVFDAAGHSSW